MNHHPFRSLTQRSLQRWTCLAAVSGWLLAGCAGFAPDQPALPDTPLPGQWTGAAPEPAVGVTTPTDLSRWWERFDDPLLTQLITQALDANTSVRSTTAALQQARALRDVQAAGLGPTLGAFGSGQRSRAGDADATNRFQAGFDASWEPDVFGGGRSALNASEADARAAETALADVRVSLAAEVAVTYIELRSLQNRLAIAGRNLALQTETLQITRWRVQAGLASSLDLEQAKAASEQTAAQLPTLQTGAAQALSALAVLTGQAPGLLQADLQRSLASVGPVPSAPATLALAFPADTLRQRPDVRTAEQRVQAALARVAQADAARYPSFRLTGSLGLNALTLSGLGSGAAVTQALLASVSVPLFDGGAAAARVEAQQAALEQARNAYQGAVLTALKDVDDALVSLRGNRERLVRLQAASDAAANAELLARQRFESGLIDFRAVLDTQRTLLSTQDGVASTQASVSADLVRLYKALGGGWSPDTPAASTSATASDAPPRAPTGR
ncbi:MAG: efflux transporter outer membrane subunit [Hydrogenophaga sp.]